jgi:hypothetical protein
MDQRIASPDVVKIGAFVTARVVTMALGAVSYEKSAALKRRFTAAATRFR